MELSVARGARPRQGACAFAEDARSKTNPGFYEASIDRFCEALLINQGRRDEAYRSYGLGAANGTTNLAIYRCLIRAYPERDPRQVLLDLIETRGDQGKWFAAAKDAGFFDIAIACAGAYGADPSTLVRAARDFQSKEPKFAATVALLALSSLLNGGGYDPRPSEANDALDYLVSASREIGAVGWALLELEKLAAQRCASGRELFQEVIKTMLSQLKSSETNFWLEAWQTEECWHSAALGFDKPPTRAPKSDNSYSPAAQQPAGLPE